MNSKKRIKFSDRYHASVRAITDAADQMYEKLSGGRYDDGQELKLACLRVAHGVWLQHRFELENEKDRCKDVYIAELTQQQPEDNKSERRESGAT